MTVRCPICKKDVPLEDPLSPFCGERCRTIDLGNWASGSYVISRPADRDELAGAARDEDDFDEGAAGGAGMSRLVH